MSRSRPVVGAGAVIGIILLALLAGCGQGDSTSQAPSASTGPAPNASITVPSAAELRTIGSDGYVYGLPIVMAYAVMYKHAVDPNSGQYKNPFNVLGSATQPYTYLDTAVVTPNSDTPYSGLWMDLRAEPMVLSVPSVDASRYFSVQLCDGNTFNYGYIGSRATGNRAGSYLVAGPTWDGKTPPGISKVFRCSTQFSLAIFRTQLFNPADLPNVLAVQTGYKAQPLSTFLGSRPPSPAPPVNFPVITDDLLVKNFFKYLDFELGYALPGPEEAPILAQLGRIGVGPLKTFSFDDLSAEQKLQVQLGIQDGDARVQQYLTGGLKIVNGWGISSLFGDRDFFNGDWLKRAAAASGGIFGNDAAEAVYPATRTMATGELLDGSKHTYKLTFAADQMPPVNAFWSVTMYDARTQLLIKNPIDRYLINSPMLGQMNKNADGSVTLFIQKDSPGAANEPNWLPAPDGPIFLVMRLYWPKETAPSILPPGTGSWSPPGLEIVQ